MLTSRHKQPEHLRGVYFKAVREGSCQQGESKSWSNQLEAEEIAKIVDKLLWIGIKKDDIGIITPYMDQVLLIEGMIKDPKPVVGTVDSFQGQERSVILVSTVRSDKTTGIGFVGDKKRLNVTLSRAKTATIIVGNDHCLKQNKLFRDLLQMDSVLYVYKI